MPAALVAFAVIAGALSVGFGPETASAQTANGSVEPVTLTSTAAGEITVSWSAPHNETATSFRINYGLADANYPSYTSEAGNHYVNNGTDRSATITGLTEGAEYKLRMRARRGTEWSGPWSADTTVTVASAADTNTVTVETETDDLANGDIPRLTLSSSESGKIEVTWTAPTKPSESWTDFRINWAKADDSYPSFSSTSGNTNPIASERSHTLADLEAGEEYKVRIRARYGTGWSGPWKEARLTVKDAAEPLIAQQQNAAQTVVLSAQTLTVTEGDTAGATYTVKLSSAPTADVTVTVSGHANSDLTLSGLSSDTLTFTDQNWDTAQTVTVTAAEDTDTADDTVTLTHTPSGGGYSTAADLTVTITDDDGTSGTSPGMVLSETSLQVIEGDTDGVTYTVKLSARPTANMTVTVSGHSNSDLTLSGLTGNALTFTPQNWDAEQTVTVTADDDTDERDDTVTLTHVLSGGSSLQTAELAVSIFDDDRRKAVVISEDFLTVLEGDATGASFTVELSSKPSGDVTVAVTGHTGNDLRVTGLTNDALTFTADNWDTAQTITITAVEDSDGTNDEESLFFSATGGSYIYSGLLFVTVTDTKSVVVSPTTLSVPEDDTNGATYTVKLASAPTASVTVTVSGHAGSDLTVAGLSSNTLTFTTQNWNAAQTVTVTAAADDDAVDDSVTLTHTPSGGGYTQATDLAVTVADNDTTGLVFSADSLTVPEGNTTGVSYTVKLATQPTANVTVTVSGHAGSDLSLSGTGLTGDALTFTTQNWNTAQTVTVTAASDADPLDDVGQLSHFASGGDYLLRDTLPLTITDDDTATAVTVETAAEDLLTREIPSVTLTSPVAGRIVVAWTAPTDIGSGVRGYHLTWRKTGYGWQNHNNTHSWSAGADDRRYVFSRLEAGTSYDIAIRALAVAGGTNGPYKVATITTSDIVVPDDTTITTDVSVTHITHDDLLMRRGTHGHLPFISLTSDKAGKIDVSWGAGNQIYPFAQTGFNIQWTKADEEYPDSSQTVGRTTAASDVRSLTLTGLDTGVAYKVRVQTVNRSCCGHISAWTGHWKEATITVASTTTARVPGVEPATDSASISTPRAELTAGELPSAAFAHASGGEISVRWTKPRSTNQGFFKEYRVNWTPNDGSAYPALSASDGNALISEENTNSHTITGLPVGEYKVRVAARYRHIYSNFRFWTGPWKEATILVSEPPPVVEDPEIALQQTRELSTAAKALTNDGRIWGDWLGTPYAVVSHNRVVLEWAKRHGDQHVHHYKIWRKAPDDTTYTLHATTPEYDPVSGSRLAQTLPQGALGSRSYYVDSAVEAETSYEYAIQADFAFDGTLISNRDQAVDDSTDLREKDAAQSFTTGSNGLGYRLTKVEMEMAVAADKAGLTLSDVPPTVSVRSTSARGTVLGTLNFDSRIPPGQTGGPNTVYSASDPIQLAANTTYWITAEGGGLAWFFTATDDEDSGGAANWSIGNSIETRDHNSAGSYTSSACCTHLLKITGQTLGLTEPLELAARTTETQPDRSPALPERVPVNAQGQVEMTVGPKVHVFPRLNEVGIDFRVPLEGGEAYRVLIHELSDHGESVGHTHSTSQGGVSGPGGFVRYLAGDVRPYDPTSDDLIGPDASLPDHVHHVFWGTNSITRASDGEVIPFNDTDLRNGRYWGGSLFLHTPYVATDALVFHAPTTDDYIIGLYSLHGGAAYGLQIVKVEDQPDAPSFGYGLDLYDRVGGQFPGPGAWGHQAAVMGNISPGDSDWFLVRLEASKTYDVQLVTQPGTRTQPLLQDSDDIIVEQIGGGRSIRYYPPLEFITVPDWKGLSNPRLKYAGRNGVLVDAPASVTVPRDAGGYYHFGVTGTSATDSGLYVLQITERDFGTTSATALRIGAGQHVIGLIERDADKDWIGAWLECDKDYRVKAHGSGGDIGGREFSLSVDLKVAAWDSRGRRLSSSTVRRYDGPSGGAYQHVLYQIGRYSEVDFDPPCTGNSGLYFFEIGPGRAGGQRVGSYYFQIVER